MQIHMSQVGPIHHAELELRPLTVLVGANHTGKSTAAGIVHAMHNLFRSVSNRGYPFARHWAPPGRAGSPTAVSAWLADADADLVLPPAVTAELRAVLDTSGDWATRLPHFLRRSLDLLTSADLLRRGGGGAAEIAWEQGPDLYMRATLDKESCQYQVAWPDTLWVDTAQGDALQHLIAEARQCPAAPDLVGRLADLVGLSLVSPLDQPVCYLPAERGRFMRMRSFMWSRPWIRDNMEAEHSVLADWDEAFPHWRFRLDEGRGAEHAARLERDLLGCTVEAQVQSNSLRCTVHGAGGAQPLHRAGSAVASLAPLVLYLRFVATLGSLLIMEEPETGLHPAAQVQLLEHLARWVQAGGRVLLTTHSEWILEALANVVLLSDLPLSQREGRGGAPALTRAQVGVWHFEAGPQGQGSQVRELPLEVDGGGYEAGFAAVGETTYNRWASISDRIEELRVGGA